VSSGTPVDTYPDPGNAGRLGFPAIVRNGEPLRLVGTCPYGSDYISLSLKFERVDGATIPESYVTAPTSTHGGQAGDGSVSALVALNLDPGDYVVKPECRVPRSPSAKVFTPFTITVTGPTVRYMGGEKEWRVVVRGESQPRPIYGSQCWKHDARVAVVAQTNGGFSNFFDMPEADVVSIEPVPAGSSGCRDL
jgi:hypothetical protein